MQFSQDNILRTAEIDSGSKKKKGKGINEILTLMKELIAFQEKVEACIDAQEMSEHKEKIEKFDQHLDDMYDQLVEIVSGGVKNVRQNRVDELGGIADESISDVEEKIPEADFKIGPTEDMLSGPNPISRPMVNAPTAPKRP